MCGLFGYAGPWSFRAASVLQALAIADEVRGKHSTGLAVLGREASFAKKALSGADFVRHGYASLLFARKFGLAIGHNRFATAGEVNDRNAHPFAIRTPRGVSYAAHNGCVGGKDLIARHFGVADVPVDSEVMFRAIGRESGRTEAEFLDSVEEVVGFIAARADFACLWLETTRPKAIYFWRSPQRPLVVFDARKAGLGRFLCSTVEIFSAAWGMVRGCLPSISKVSSWEAKPMTVYRVVDDGTWEVEPLRRIKQPAPPKAAQVQAHLWGGEESDDGPRVFDCASCGTPVDAEYVVMADPHTGRLASGGKPHHESCVAAPAGGCLPESSSAASA